MKKIIAIVAVFLLLVTSYLFIKTPYWIALTKSKSHFIVSNIDSRVLYEPGAEENANKFAEFLQTAINTIEYNQFKTFKKPFKVYVCNSQKSLNEYIATDPTWPIRGTVLKGDIYIAPSAFDFREQNTYKETLLHEMSHLHFRQRLGFIKERKIPQWFREGFADYVSGAGGEGISENDAINNIINGNHFILNDMGKPFSREVDELNGLTYPMYHQQVKMFVTFIAETNKDDFNLFITLLLEGGPFNETFSNILKVNLQDSWSEFVSQLIFENEQRFN